MADAIAIRDYRLSDLDAVIAIYQAAIRAMPADIYKPQQIEAWSHVDREEWSRARAAVPTWVAEADGAPAGFATLDAKGEIEWLFVRPDNQRKGVAAALLAHVEAVARQRWLERVFVQVAVTARPFFEKHGFREMKAVFIEREGQPLASYGMEKWLG